MGIDKRFSELDVLMSGEEAATEIDRIAESNTFYPDSKTEQDGYPEVSETTAQRLGSLGSSGYIKVIKPKPTEE